MTRIGWAGLCSGLILVGLVGCATTPSSNFFVLSAGEVPTQGSPSGIALSIGPVDLPRYLDRPQIVSREGDNRLEVDEFNRWGGALDDVSADHDPSAFADHLFPGDYGDHWHVQSI
mgnify:CR=1 FL=1